MKRLISEERTWFWPTEDIRALEGRGLCIVDRDGGTTLAKLGLRHADPAGSHAGMVSVVMTRASAEKPESAGDGRGPFDLPLRIELRSDYLTPGAVDLLRESGPRSGGEGFTIELSG